MCKWTRTSPAKGGGERTLTGRVHLLQGAFCTGPRESPTRSAGSTDSSLKAGSREKRCSPGETGNILGDSASHERLSPLEKLKLLRN